MPSGVVLGEFRPARVVMSSAWRAGVAGVAEQASVAFELCGGGRWRGIGDVADGGG